MIITVNGDPAELAGPTTVGALLRQRLPVSRGVAVAVNDTVVPRDRHEATALTHGDRVEIVTAVQGG